MEKLYYTAKEVAEMLDVSVSHAYKVIREANKELSSKGFYGKCIILCSYKQWQECDNK